jgi:hypothetical protein
VNIQGESGTGVKRVTIGKRSGNWVTDVQRFVRPRKAAEPHCELCGMPIAADHRHLAEPAKGRLLCACRECTILLGNNADGRFRAVPVSAWRLEHLPSSFTARHKGVSSLSI